MYRLKEVSGIIERQMREYQYSAVHCINWYFLPLVANIKKRISYLLSSASIKENVKEKVRMLNYLKSNSNRKRSISCLLMHVELAHLGLTFKIQLIYTKLLLSKEYRKLIHVKIVLITGNRINTLHCT